MPPDPEDEIINPEDVPDCDWGIEPTKPVHPFHCPKCKTDLTEDSFTCAETGVKCL